MTGTLDYNDIIGRTAVDVDGDKIGKIAQIYVDDTTDEPQWVTISTGLFGTKESFAPLRGSHLEGDDLQLAVQKSQVKDAPNVDADGQLEESENQALYRHYEGSSGPAGAIGDSSNTHDLSDGRGMDNAVGAEKHADSVGHDQLAGDVAAISPRSDAEFTARGQDTSGPNTDGAMTRSEERLDIGTQSVESGRARLRKYVVTENVTQTVPVSHEEVRIEREPITDANRGDAVSGAAISEEEHEVTLHAEQPVVSKDTVPVERVKLGTETVTEEATVNEELRKEQIDTDNDQIGRSDR